MPKVWIWRAGSKTIPTPLSISATPINPRVLSHGDVAHRTSEATIVPDAATMIFIEVGYASCWNATLGDDNISEGKLTDQKWEYTTVPLISHALQEILNQWGEEGWELVQVLESPSLGMTAYLKRPKQGDTSSG
jgi:Domain of unknown function (DUF4177)